MTEFKQLKSIYNQLFNVADEIKSMMDKEEFNEAITKLQYKDILIEKFALTKKNITLTDEEKEEIVEIEAKLKKIEFRNIEFLKGLHSDVARELKKTNNSLKINRAYSKKGSQQGSMLDLSE